MGPCLNHAWLSQEIFGVFPFFIEDVIPEEFRSCPCQGAHSRDLREVVRRHELGKANICDLGSPIACAKNIGALQVKLQHKQTTLIGIRESSCSEQRSQEQTIVTA